MCFIVVSKTQLRKLVAAAQNIQALIDDGTIPAAFTNPSDHSTTLTITAFDVLAANASQVALQIGAVSPFLRYRREILAEGERGHGLRQLWANLFGGRQGLNLSAFFQNADEHHTRIALEMIAGYTKHGENDPYFMALADAPAMWPIVNPTSREGSPS